MTAWTIRPASAGDRDRIVADLEDWGMRPVARLGELYDPAGDPALLAVDADGMQCGLLTYRIDDRGLEIGTLHAATQRQGIGSALVDAAMAAAREAGIARVWLVTTNDNLDAIRFYQRRGFKLSALRPDAVREARKLKPEIPAVGDFGIPITDELDLERWVAPRQ